MTARLILGIFFIALGISAFTGFDIGRFIGPLFLIFIGWMILRKPSFDKYGKNKSSEQDFINEVFIFSGTQRRLISKDFTGGKIVVIFGGAELDLKDAVSKENKIKLELVSVFGGIRLRIPETWFVTSKVVGIIGGMDNKTSPKLKNTELHVSGAAIFGGIEITN